MSLGPESNNSWPYKCSHTRSPKYIKKIVCSGFLNRVIQMTTLKIEAVYGNSAKSIPLNKSSKVLILLAGAIHSEAWWRVLPWRDLYCTPLNPGVWSQVGLRKHHFKHYMDLFPWTGHLFSYINRHSLDLNLFLFILSLPESSSEEFLNAFYNTMLFHKLSLSKIISFHSLKKRVMVIDMWQCVVNVEGHSGSLCHMPQASERYKLFSPHN